MTTPTPFRIAVDLDRLRAIIHPGAAVREVGEFVEHVVAMRAEPPDDGVWARARDTHRLPA